MEPCSIKLSFQEVMLKEQLLVSPLNVSNMLLYKGQDTSQEVS